LSGYNEPALTNPPVLETALAAAVHPDTNPDLVREHAFRIMRLAGKLKSLKRIIAALTQSIVPVANSFIILLTAGCIFSVLGVEFFGYRSVAAFGTFSRAAWTLWMVLAFGEWEDEALPVFRPGIGTIDAWVLLYIVMLVFVMLWVLLQVVVALLLDNFVQSKASSDAEDEAAQLEEAESQGGSCLQPLVKAFLLTFDTAAQLNTGIMKLFLVLDVGGEGWIDFQKAKIGLRKLRTRPTIHLLKEVCFQPPPARPCVAHLSPTVLRYTPVNCFSHLCSAHGSPLRSLPSPRRLCKLLLFC